MRDSAVMYRNFMKAVKRLPVEKQGAAYEAYLMYAMDGEEYVGDDYAIAALLESFRDQLDEDREKYKAKCARTQKINSERNRNEVETKSKRNRTEVESDIDIDIDSKERVSKDTPKKAHPRFAPPTVAEVAEYCRERQNTVDPQTFVDFYASKGWMVGKSPMKDWKACVRTWERDRVKQKPPDQHGISREEDLDSMMMQRMFGGRV